MAPWLIWIAMAALAATACLPLLAPLYRERRARASSAGAAAAIYRDQLAEVDRDVASGTIAAGEAEAARTEIARRLIRAGDQGAATPAPAERPPRFAVALILAMPLAALALYMFVGSPNYPGQPLAARPEVQQAEDVATLVAAVEAHLAAAPDDGAGWEVIAPVYVRLGRAADAVRAWSNAIRILGATADRQTGLGEAIVRAAGGMVTADARAAFERARGLAPEDPRPRFYLALALEQDGRTAEAIAAWRALLDGAPADATWVPLARRQLAALEQTGAAPGPNAADVEAAANLSPEDRNAMIEGMVASLAQRLAAEPGDAEGWARLIRSYMVLGRGADAADAVRRARTALVGDAAGLTAVEGAAREAGLETAD